MARKAGHDVSGWIEAEHNKRQSFTVRISKVGNELSDLVMNAPRVNTFKTGWTDTGGKKTSFTTTKHPYQDSTWLRPGLSDLNTMI